MKTMKMNKYFSMAALGALRVISPGSYLFIVTYLNGKWKRQGKEFFPTLFSRFCYNSVK